MSETSRQRLWRILYPNKPYKPKDGNTMSQDPNDIITRAELKEALETRKNLNNRDGQLNFGFYTPKSLADSIIDSVKYKSHFDHPSTDKAPVSRFPGSKTITLTELDDALRRHGYADFSTPHHVEKLWSDILAHREPEWQVGDIVRSSLAGIWIKLADGQWRAAGAQNVVADHVPTRPLKLIGRTAA